MFAVKSKIVYNCRRIMPHSKGEKYMSGLTNPLINDIKKVLQTARQNIATQVNAELLTTYWNIGRIIVEHEQNNKARAEYGAQTLKDLSKYLTAEQIQ